MQSAEPNAKAAAMFTKLVQDGRRKMMLDEQATLMLGSGRWQTAPGSENPQKATPAGGLISPRIGGGVTKLRGPPRSAAALSISALRNGSLRPHIAPRTASESTFDRRARALEDVMSDFSTSRLRDQVTVNGSSDDLGFSFKGRGAPQRATVISENFAPGTTASDIDSVMNDYDEQAQSRILTSRPIVIAETVFMDRKIAELVVEKYNGKKADGWELTMWIRNTPNQAPGLAAAPARAPQTGPKADRLVELVDDSMDIDLDRQRYDEQRKNSAKRAEAQYQDGRYGFDEPEQYRDAKSIRSAPSRGPQRLYSDSMINQRLRWRGRSGR